MLVLSGTCRGEQSLLDVSVGKQIYQIRDGFLLSKIPVSTSIGERAALYLGPRITSEFTALAKIKSADLGLDAFFIEPSEISEIASDTQVVGFDLRNKFKRADAALSYFYVPQSKTTYRSPSGRSFAARGAPYL